LYARAGIGVQKRATSVWVAAEPFKTTRKPPSDERIA
jgi:hypothetical protein